MTNSSITKFLIQQSNDLNHVLQYLMGNCPNMTTVIPTYKKQFDPKFLVCYNKCSTVAFFLTFIHSPVIILL